MRMNTVKVLERSDIVVVVEKMSNGVYNKDRENFERTS